MPDSEAIRDSIIEVAISTFPTLGYRGCSLETIAQGAGIPSARLRSLFRNKENLFQATMEAYAWRFKGLCPPAERCLDLRSTLISYGKNLTTALLSSERASWDRMLIQTAVQFPRLASRYTTVGPLAGLRLFANFLSVQKREEYDFGDAYLSAELFHGMLYGVKQTLNLYSPDIRPPDHPVIEAVVERFLKAHTT